MKRILLLLLLAAFFLIAYASKPDDKACILAGVAAVWGPKVPDQEKFPEYFEQFMDATSQAVAVQDWVFLKRIQYRYGNEMKTIGVGAFKRVYTF